MFASQQTTINVTARELTKKITRRAYSRKKIVFLEYCYHAFGHEAFCENVTVLKIYRFMIYQCHRKK